MQHLEGNLRNEKAEFASSCYEASSNVMKHMIKHDILCEEAKSDISVSSVGLVTKASLDGGAILMLLRVKKDWTRFKVGRSDKRIGLGDGIRSCGGIL